jgi:hypothetical protein
VTGAALLTSKKRRPQVWESNDAAKNDTQKNPFANDIIVPT